MLQQKIAIVQKSPIPNDKDACIDLAIKCIQDAASAGAAIVVFGECWLSGYPAWIDFGLHVAKWNYEPIKEAWADVYRNGIDIEGLAFNKIKKEAAASGVYVIMGLNEIIPTGRGNHTIYNTAYIIDQGGELLLHHRKLMPTFNEKLIHGMGDAHGLQSVDTEYGRLGVLICWEHWMPMTRQVMHDAAEDIHFALWPTVKNAHITATKNYAFEGKCYVISVGQMLRIEQMPESIDLPESLDIQDGYVLQGGSCMAGPDGELILEPHYLIDDILYIDMPSKDELIKEKMNLSVSGHYQRPDIFTYQVNRRRMTSE